MLVIAKKHNHCKYIHFLIAVDYIKLKILYPNIEYLLNLDCLDFKTEVSTKTGELSNKRIAKYHFCKIIIYDSGVVFFQGSIHKLWNSLNGIKAPNYNPTNYKGFNGNTFTLIDFYNAREHLKILLNCRLSDMLIQNIEYGINLNTLFNPMSFIKGLLFYKGKMFVYKEYENKRTNAQVQFQQYILKIYNKGKQYGMQKNVLRVEIKITRTAKQQETNITTLEDVNKRTLLKANNLLLKHFKNVTYYDYTIRKKELNNLNKNRIKNYSNPRYWIVELNTQKRKRQKTYLKNIINNHSDKLHQNIIDLINQKCTLFNQLSENPKCTLFNYSSIVLSKVHLESKKLTKNDTTKKVKKCIITGVDISMQKENSFLLSINRIRELYYTNRKLFDEVKNKYLSKKWIDADLETQIKEIYHNIRNKASNIRIRRKRVYPKHQFSII